MQSGCSKKQTAKTEEQLLHSEHQMIRTAQTLHSEMCQFLKSAAENHLFES